MMCDRILNAPRITCIDGQTGLSVLFRHTKTVHMNRTLMMALLASLTLTGVAQAQAAYTPGAETTPPEGRPDRPERPYFATLEADDNGALTLEKVQSPGAARFAAADTNGDGGLSAGDRAAEADQRRAERTAKMIVQRDSNGYGLLQAEEMGPKGDLMEKMFHCMDVNDDGTIDADELEAAADRMDHGGLKGHGDHDGKGCKQRG
jgi:hypothetical protein